MPANSREYNKKNYMKYWWNEKAKKDRNTRNVARYRALRDGKVHKWDWKDIDHKTPISSWGGNTKWNTRVISVTKNRRDWAKIATAHKKKK